MSLTSEDLDHLFASFERSAFRLQLLPEYVVDAEREDYKKFLAGEPLPDRASVPWLEVMRHQAELGRTWTTIHLLPSHLTPYLRYLIDWWYVHHDRAGAKIGFLPNQYTREMSALAPYEFWLFDDVTLILLHYDLDGRFHGAKDASSEGALAAAQRARDFAIANALDLRTVLAQLRTGSRI
jgi:hypothetical protein